MYIPTFYVHEPWTKTMTTWKKNLDDDGDDDSDIVMSSPNERGALS